MQGPGGGIGGLEKCEGVTDLSIWCFFNPAFFVKRHSRSIVRSAAKKAWSYFVGAGPPPTAVMSCCSRDWSISSAIREQHQKFLVSNNRAGAEPNSGARHGECTMQCRVRSGDGPVRASVRCAGGKHE